MSLWSLEIKKCSTSIGMSDYVLCGHTLGRVLVSMIITACEGFHFIGGIWQFSIILQSIYTFWIWKKKKRQATHTEQLVLV